MSDPSTLTVVGIVIAVVITVIWIRWRQVRNPQAAKALSPSNSASAGADSSEGSTQTSTIGQEITVNRFTIVTGLLALGIAGLGQYWLVTQRIGFAWVGYGIGSLLFVSSLWRLTPENFESPPPAAVATEPTSKPRFWPLTLALPKSRAAQPAPSVQPVKAPTQPQLKTQRMGFLNTWRYYTVADILYRREPKLPPPPEVPFLPESAPAPLIEDKPLSEVVIEPSIAEIPLPVSLTTWGDLGRPESLAVAADGRVFVWDTQKQIIHEFQADGQTLNKWPVHLKDLGSIQRLAVAPDGRTIYLADVERGQLHRIVLGE